MEFIVYEMKYTRGAVEKSGIACVPFEEACFAQYKALYNACYYEMRKALCRKPYNVIESYEQISARSKDIFLLFDREVIVGSVACCGCEIDDLFVNRAYQNNGYGKQLLLWGMNHIRESCGGPISLQVAEWNQKALRLYERVGFTITKAEIICRTSVI